MEVHDSCIDQVFNESPFRVNLIDSAAALMKLLLHLERLCSSASNGHEVAIAVDFEGVKLCRHGALCLMQMTCDDDRSLVYVIDVYLLKSSCFNLQTPNGTSMKGVLENPQIRKVWFDPRNKGRRRTRRGRRRRGDEEGEEEGEEGEEEE